MRSTYIHDMKLRSGNFKRTVSESDDGYDHHGPINDHEYAAPPMTRSRQKSLKLTTSDERQSHLSYQRSERLSLRAVSINQMVSPPEYREEIHHCRKSESKSVVLPPPPPPSSDDFMHDPNEKRTYQCHLCGKTFRHFCRLKVHMPSHTRETPYQCKLCPKRYKSSSSLNVHRKSHSGSWRRNRPTTKNRANRSSTTSNRQIQHSTKQHQRGNKLVKYTGKPTTSTEMEMEMEFAKFLDVKIEPSDLVELVNLSDLDPLAIDFTPFVWDDSDSEAIVTSTTMNNGDIESADYAVTPENHFKTEIDSNKMSENACSSFNSILKTSDKANRIFDTELLDKPIKLELWQKESDKIGAYYVDILRKPKSKRSLFPSKDTNQSDSSQKIHNDQKSTELAVNYRDIGDTHFILKNWHVAREFYNRTLCHAEQKTFYFSTAYAKRAQCFFNMGMYKMSMTDLYLAEQSDLPKNLLAQLERHKQSCKMMMQQSMNEMPSIEPKLSFDPDEMFPEMANVLQITWNERFGRHIVAEQAIDVGQIVIIEKGFVSTTTDYYEKCCICLTGDTNLIPCTKCTTALLCKRCVRGRLHQIECELQSSLNIVENPWLPKLIRSIVNAILLFSSVDEMMKFVEESVMSADLVIPTAIIDRKSKYRSFLQLDTKPLLELGLIPVIIQLQSAISTNKSIGRTFAATKHRRFLAHLLLHHLSVIEKFATKTCGDGEKICVDTTAPITSYLNHSCAPNVAKFLLGDSVIAVVMRPIKKGEQLFVSYCDVLKCYSDRQRILHEKYGFQCNCERCITALFTPTIGMNHDYLFQNQADPNEVFVQENFVYLASENQDKRKQLTERVMDVLQRFGQMTWNYKISWAYVIYSILLSHRFQKKLLF